MTFNVTTVHGVTWQTMLRAHEEPVQSETWYYVLPDWLQGDPEYHFSPTTPIRGAALDLGGAPDVFRTGNYGSHKNYRKVPMTKEIQFFNADLMSWMKYNKPFKYLVGAEYDDIVKCFTGTFGDRIAFCNKTFAGRANFIKGENLSAELPLFNPLICGTNSLQGEEVGDYLKVKTFKFGEPLPEITSRDIFNDPRVVIATTITGKQVNDGYAVNHFPRLNGTYGVPYALVTMEDVYYPLWYKTGKCLNKYQALKRRDMYNYPQPWPF